jgi:small subunit ribosomal protein S1
VSQGDTVRVQILEVDAERRRLSLSLKRVDGAARVAPADEPIEGTPHLDLSEDVFTDAELAPEAPPLEPAATDAPPAADAVEREAVNGGDDVDPAAADELARGREER